jgi:hypothetical protein
MSKPQLLLLGLAACAGCGLPTEQCETTITWRVVNHSTVAVTVEEWTEGDIQPARRVRVLAVVPASTAADFDVYRGASPGFFSDHLEVSAQTSLNLTACETRFEQLDCDWRTTWEIATDLKMCAVEHREAVGRGPAGDALGLAPRLSALATAS